jgi:cytochrome c
MRYGKSLSAFGAALTFTTVLGGVVSLTGHPNTACAAQPQASFKEDVFPIFKGRCIECHQPGGQGYEQSGLDLSTYQGVMKGSKFGPIVVPRDPDTSNLSGCWIGGHRPNFVCHTARKSSPPATETRSENGSERAQKTIRVEGL